MLNLTKKERNDVFSLIERKGLNPLNFSWQTHVSKFVSVYEQHSYEALSGYKPDAAEALITVHDRREFSFTFERDDKGVYFAAVEPHINVGNGVRTPAWSGLLQAFDDWLEVVRYETQETDFWSQLPHGAPLASIPRKYTDNEHFTPDEVVTLRDRLKEIESFIIGTNSLKGGPATQVRQTFVYLQESAQTATKVDWKNIFVGSVVSIILSLAVDNAPAIFSLCNRLLAPLFAKLIQ